MPGLRRKWTFLVAHLRHPTLCDPLRNLYVFFLLNSINIFAGLAMPGRTCQTAPAGPHSRGCQPARSGSLCQGSKSHAYRPLDRLNWPSSHPDQKNQECKGKRKRPQKRRRLNHRKKKKKRHATNQDILGFVPERWPLRARASTPL